MTAPPEGRGMEEEELDALDGLVNAAAIGGVTVTAQGGLEVPSCAPFLTLPVRSPVEGDLIRLLLSEAPRLARAARENIGLRKALDSARADLGRARERADAAEKLLERANATGTDCYYDGSERVDPVPCGKCDACMTSAKIRALLAGKEPAK